MHPACVKNARDAVPIWFASRRDAAAVLGKLDAGARAFAKAAGFEGRPGEYLPLPGKNGALIGVLFGQDARREPQADQFAAGRLADLLPGGTYRFANVEEPRLAALAFALGAYKFGRYRKGKAGAAKLVLPDGVDGEELSAIVEAVALARDLINTPSNDMGPADLEAAARKLAKQHRARFAVTSGTPVTASFGPVMATMSPAVATSSESRCVGSARTW